MPVPQLRPLSIGEILDAALKIWRRHFPALARIVLFVVAPVQVVSSLLLASVLPEDELVFDFETGGFDSTDPAAEPFGSDFDGGDAGAFLAGVGLVALLSGLAFVLASAAALRAVTVAYLGETPDWKESLRLAVHRLGALTWLACLMGVFLSLAFLLVVVPGVWLSVAWSLAFVALVAEDLTSTRALQRSFALVQGRWWPTFGVLFIAFVLNFVVDQIIAIPFALATFVSDDSLVGFGLSALASIISDVITTPFVAAVFVLVYFDLRVRKEGFDLELLARAMGPAPESESPGSGASIPDSPPQWPAPPTDWRPPGSAPGGRS